MKVVIIEDEEVNYRNLVRKLDLCPHEIDITAWLKGISQATTWFEDNHTPDLIFLDLQLADGLAFTIFEKCDINCPVIIITAFEQYALKAFEIDSVDYLLKPFTQQKLNDALNKFQNRHKSQTIDSKKVLELLRQIQTKEVKYKDRFHVKRGSNFLSSKQMKLLGSIEMSTFS